jgi:FMN-dependent NADH-azoreductase
MAKVLYITANPNPASQSVSLSVGDEFLGAYQAHNPGDEIIKVDLYQTDLQELDGDVLSAWGKFRTGGQPTAVELEKIQKMNTILDQFLEADKYVFVTPMWNFGFPPRVKTYLDALCIPGKTFNYTETGPVGLLGGKKVVHIHATGGVYSEGPAAAMNFADPYLRAIMGFLGVTSYENVLAEGMNQFPTEVETIKQKAIARAREVAKAI